jgi:hypothetical protein
MNALLKKFFAAALLATLLTLSDCGSGDSGPAADIPAPVSHLSISSPDAGGEVRITGSAGLTDAGTTITISNPNATSSDLWKFFIRQAYAHTTHTTAADADGSFQTSIEGAVGDAITVSYVSGGETQSDSLTVPANVPALPITADIQDVSIDPTTGKALIVANDGVDGFVHIVDLTDKAYESSLTLPGASGASQITTDPTTGETIVLDTVNDTAIHLTAGAATIAATTTIVGSSDAAAGPSGGYVLIAHTDSTPALSFFNLTSDTATATGDSASEDGTDQRSAERIALDADGTGDIAVVLSLMPDSSFILTTHRIDTVVPSITQNGAVLLDADDPAGLALFNDGGDAFVTDADNDAVLRVDLAGGGTTSIDVGDAPRGVAVDETGGDAYVVNSAGHTVSVIALTDNTVAATEEVGLSPTEIAIGSVSGTATIIVINTGDETATIL